MAYFKFTKDTLVFNVSALISSPTNSYDVRCNKVKSGL